MANNQCLCLYPHVCSVKNNHRYGNLRMLVRLCLKMAATLRDDKECERYNIESVMYLFMSVTVIVNTPHIQ